MSDSASELTSPSEPTEGSCGCVEGETVGRGEKTSAFVGLATSLTVLALNGLVGAPVAAKGLGATTCGAAEGCHIESA